MIMHRIAALFLLGSLFLACNKEEALPAYVRVEPFAVDEPGGAKMHRFTEGWFYAGGDYLGAYTLPADIPVLAEGDQEILVFPGVKENGINATPNIYPLMNWHIETKNLRRGAVTEVQPRVKYDSRAKFAWGVEQGSFDGSSNVGVDNLDDDNALNYTFATADGFDGRYLLMQVDTAHPAMQIAFEPVTLPFDGGRQVWMELHYRNNMSMQLLLIGLKSGQPTQSIPVFVFNSKPEWNKIYINLTDFLSANPYDSYRLFFQLLNTDPTGKTKGHAHLDNVRLVHF